MRGAVPFLDTCIVTGRRFSSGWTERARISHGNTPIQTEAETSNRKCRLLSHNSNEKHPESASSRYCWLLPAVNTQIEEGTYSSPAAAGGGQILTRTYRLSSDAWSTKA